MSKRSVSLGLSGIRKGMRKPKGKWPQKQGRPQDAGEKENVAPNKEFNMVRQVHGSDTGERQKKSDGTRLLECWPYIYSAQEASTVWDVGQSIPQIYVVLDNKKAKHQATDTKTDGKLYD